MILLNSFLNTCLQSYLKRFAFCFSATIMACSLLINPIKAFATNNDSWEELQPGLSHIRLTGTADKRLKSGHLDAFKIDLTHYQLALLTAKDINQTTTNVRALAKESKGLVAINGGFFTPEFEPLGLRIQSGKEISPLRATSWWGVFYLRDGKPYIVSHKNFQENQAIELAVQAGPRLLVNGNIPQLKSGTDERSAICIDKKNYLILAATTNAQLHTYELATLLKDKLGCWNALNLDGGQSTQLYARIGLFYMYTRYFSNIVDALVVLEES